MKAAIYYGPNDIRIEDVPIPEITKSEILIKVLSASVCGTDLRIFHGNHRMYPEGTIRIPGHEVVGMIDKIGIEVDGYSIGQRVFVAPNTGCGHCKQCISGNNNVCKDYDAIGVTRTDETSLFRARRDPVPPGHARHDVVYDRRG